MNVEHWENSGAALRLGFGNQRGEQGIGLLVGQVWGNMEVEQVSGGPLAGWRVPNRRKPLSMKRTRMPAPRA